jgi:hypothetical protein
MKAQLERHSVLLFAGFVGLVLWDFGGSCYSNPWTMVSQGPDPAKRCN